MFGDTASESIEAITFFTTAYQFNVPHSQSGINAMLSLIYSSDANIKAAIINAYTIIYFKSEESNDSTTKVKSVMKNLFFIYFLLYTIIL